MTEKTIDEWREFLDKHFPFVELTLEESTVLSLYRKVYGRDYHPVRKQKDSVSKAEYKLLLKELNNNVYYELEQQIPNARELNSTAIKKMNNNRLARLPLTERIRIYKESLKKHAIYEAKRKAKETPEQRKARLKKATTSISKKIKNETPEEGEERRRKNRERRRKKKAKETPAERAARKKKEKAWREANKDYLKEEARKWHEKNREKQQQYAKEWRENLKKNETPEQYQARLEKQREASKRCYYKNLERSRKLSKDRKERSKEKKGLAHEKD